MLGNAKILSDGVNKLEGAKKMAYETEEIAIGIQDELHKQTDKINNAIGKVYPLVNFRTKTLDLI